MLRNVLFLVVYTTLMTGLALACALLARRNFKAFRRTRGRPPLDPNEVYAAPAPTTAVPRSWPQPLSVDDHRLAAAYRDYARDRRASLLVIGELLVLTGGAALGASIPLGIRGGWYLWPGIGALMVALVGLFLRLRAEFGWTSVARRYDLRRADLQAECVRLEAEVPAEHQPDPRSTSLSLMWLRATGAIRGRARRAS